MSSPARDTHVAADITVADIALTLRRGGGDFRGTRVEPTGAGIAVENNGIVDEAIGSIPADLDRHGGSVGGAREQGNVWVEDQVSARRSVPPVAVLDGTVTKDVVCFVVIGRSVVFIEGPEVGRLSAEGDAKHEVALNVARVGDCLDGACGIIEPNHRLPIPGVRHAVLSCVQYLRRREGINEGQ